MPNRGDKISKCLFFDVLFFGGAVVQCAHRKHLVVNILYRMVSNRPGKSETHSTMSIIDVRRLLLKLLNLNIKATMASSVAKIPKRRVNRLLISILEAVCLDMRMM